MIPDIEVLTARAASILSSIPAGLDLGEATAGLYGIGFLGRWALPRLRESGVNLVACYDANPALHGTSVESVPVHPASKLKNAPPDFVFISARHAIKPVAAKLSDLGIGHVSYDAWYVARNFAAFRRIHDETLIDDRSKVVLRAAVMAMLTSDDRYCAAVFEKDQYFCLPPFCGTHDESYVDAGAFAGDSVERFIWAHNGLFSHIYAFEPGPRQFAALKARTNRLIDEWALDPASVTLVNAGLGETGGTVSAKSDHGQLTSFTIRNDTAAGPMVDVVNVDSILQGKRISLLKADVEGMEMALLKGARIAIQSDKPKIAICVYHYPADIPEITNYLAALVPDYRFAMRHHSPHLLETVLYAWTD